MKIKNKMSQSDGIKIELGLSAKVHGERFRRQQSSSKKAEQIYRNTLAVFAVNEYLQNMGWLTSLETSSSWDYISQSLMDVADLDIVDRGKIECRVVLKDRDYFTIPTEVMLDRIAYIAVKFDDNFEEAILLGFVEKVNKQTIPLSELQAIREFIPYLEKVEGINRRLKNPISPAILSNWLEGISESTWQPIQPSFSFRSFTEIESNREIVDDRQEYFSEGISRQKLFIFPKDIEVLLVVSIRIDEYNELEAILKFYPVNIQNLYLLSEGIDIKILDEVEDVVINAKMKQENKVIEIVLNGKPGDYFTVEISLNDLSKVEALMF